MKFKRFLGIRYYSDTVSDCGKFRLWLSKTHPTYKHWTKIKA